MALILLASASGQHAAVVYEAAQLSGLEVAGFIMLEVGPPPQILDCFYLGNAEMLEDSAFVQRFEMVTGCGSNRLRQFATEKLRAKGALFRTVVHPRAILSPSARIGAGSVILAGAIVGPSARIGSAVIVNHGASVDHDCTVDDYANLCPGARLGGRVHVGTRAFVGLNASVLPGRILSPDAMVGAGAVVTRDVPTGITVTGSPARVC